jgi:ABC-type sulfate/molybdate transport systems ATPase subunit
MALHGHRMPRGEARNRVLEALALCSIGDVAQRWPGQLSGGQQQRPALARAIALHPAFLLLDEPFAGLDLALKQALFRQIFDLARRKHITLIMVTHDPLEAVHLCQRAIVLSQGTEAEMGNMADLIRRSEAELFRAFREEIAALSMTCG